MKDANVDTIIQSIREQCPNGDIVFVSGIFNVLHPGHLRLLEFAAEQGDFLVVGVLPDRHIGVILPQEIRLKSIAALGIVNYPFILQSSLEEFISELQPTLIVKGREHSDKFNPEAEIITAYGGRLLFSSGDSHLTLQSLLKSEASANGHLTIRKPSGYPQRHNFDTADLLRTVERFSGLKALVIGDLILDEYVNCEPVGMSQEDPTIVVSPIESKTYVGGAGIVAGHAGSLGAAVHFFSVSGADEKADYAINKLSEYGVTPTILKDNTRKTTLKRRYQANGKTLLRVNHMNIHDLGEELANIILQGIEAEISKADLLIFSDFNYGCLTQELVDSICELAHDNGVPLFADSQSSSQIGNICRFKNMKLICPTEHEARIALHDSSSGLITLAENLIENANPDHVVVTLGADGVLIHSPQANKDGLFSDRIEAMNVMPRDVSGAGDAFLTCSALALAAGADIWRAAYLGSIGAACHVSQAGNTPIPRATIIQELGN